MKKRILVFLLFMFSLMLFAPSIQAQKKSKVTNKTVIINGKEYYKHYVTNGETLYGLSKAYKVPVEEIIRLNPFVEKGLQAGHRVLLPIKVKPKQNPKPKPKPADKPKTDSVSLPKETPKVDPIPEPKPEPKVEPKPEPIVEPEPEPIVEPEPEPIVEPEPEPKVEPAPEPKVEPAPEPIVEPEPEPMIEPEPKVEPEPEPKVEPEPEPKVEPEPKEEQVAPQTPVIDPEKKPRITFNDKEYYLHDVKSGETLEAISEAYHISVEKLVQYNPDLKHGLKVGLVLGIPVQTESEESEAQVAEHQEVTETVKPVSSETIALVSPEGLYTLQPKEDLYDVAKRFGVDLSDLKTINPELNNNPKRGTMIEIPKIINENDYIVHHCEKNERVTSLLRRWKVSESEFRKKNVSVGSHVFVNQVVLIPIEPISDFYWIKNDMELVDEEEPSTHAEPKFDFDAEMGEIPVCVASPENVQKRYNVALMVPLFLQDIDNIEVTKEKAKNQKSRSLGFLQYYEGFVMAAEALEKQGLKVDLTVFDVTDNVASAEKALRQIRGKDLDLIVGPFFGRSFSVIEEYAKANDIVVVNPLSTRLSVIADNPNVVKVKPGDLGLVLTISNLVKNNYSDANVFIVSREKASDSTFLNQLEHHLNLAVQDEVTVSGNEFLHFARNESERLEMGSRLVSTVDVEGQVYSTDDFRNGSMDKVVLANPIKRYEYSDMGKLKSQLSGVRTNLIVAYGDDNVFATGMLNSLSTEADRFPITLVCAPDWSQFEKLLVDNLLKMNAIYASDYFIDYESDAAKQFVRRFRSKYMGEPQKYAFEGYDLGYYFLSALMQYGSDDLLGCLHCCQIPMLHTNYRFYYKNYLDKGGNYGKENLFWNLYQFDNELIKLVPVDPFKRGEQ